MDNETVTAAIEGIRRALRADGADLILLDADPKTARIRMRLDLDGVDCLDCVLAPEALHDTVAQSLQSGLHEEFELVISDPRRQGPG